MSYDSFRTNKSHPAERGGETSMPTHLRVEDHGRHVTLQLLSEDGTNRLTRAFMRELSDALLLLRSDAKSLVITGNPKFFSAGADLPEIRGLTGPSALTFASLGQNTLNTIAHFPGPVYAAIHGYCMGGGLDLALACRRRIASPHAIFGHRGAALGLMTGWGGTQRLPKLVGKGKALAMFLAAEKLHAKDALAIGLIDGIAEDPCAEAVRRLATLATSDTHTGAT